MKVYTTKSNIFNILKWVLITVIPTIIASLFAVFTLGADAKTYVNKVEHTEKKIDYIEPKINKQEIDIATLFFKYNFIETDIETTKKNIKDLEILANSINQNLAKINQHIDDNIRQDVNLQKRLDRFENMLDEINRK